MFNSGLVIGKFYPFHKGHEFLIREASENCEQVTVIVMGSQFQKYSVNQRVAWIRETFKDSPNVQVVGIKDDVYDDYNDHTIWLHHVQIMRAALVEAGVGNVDAVFTSEEYGFELAKHFNAEHILVDLHRETYPTSGTMVRSGLYHNWGWLPDVVKETLCTRVVVVGAESTGTTTLSKDLAEHYQNLFKIPALPNLPVEGNPFKNTVWIPEYGRDYTYEKLAETEAANLGKQIGMDDLVWTVEDFMKIGLKQTFWETQTVKKEDASPLIICDTDALATTVWEDRYIGGDASGNREYGENLPSRDIYLITNHEGVLFEQDGIRDGEHIRENMTGEFIKLLTRKNLSWALLTGDREHRLNVAVKIINQILESKTSGF